MPFQIEWTRTEDDYVRAVLLNHSSTKMQRILMPVTFALLLLYGLVFGTDLLFVGFAAAYAVVLAMHFGIRWVGLSRHARRVFRQQKSLHRPMVLEVGAEGVRARSGQEDQSFLRWQDAYRWVEGKEDILVFPSDAIFYMLPKQRLEAEELDELRGYLEKAQKT